MVRWTVLAACLAAYSGSAAGCGDETTTCAPACGPGFLCFYGVCVPSGIDAAAEADIPLPADDAGREDAPETPADTDPDIDDDGIFNPDDNCPWVPNPAQENCDGDAAGDACDDDDDGDGIPDVRDPCSACDPPPDTHDEDGDGIVDPCDLCPEVPDSAQADSDGDGVGDLCEWPGDSTRVGERTQFMSFAESAGWDPDGGSWWRRDDMMGQDLLFGGASVYSRTWSFGDEMMVRTWATWGSGADTTYRLAGVLLRVRRSAPLPVDWFFCCGNMVDHSVQIWSYVDGAFDLLAEEPLAVPLEPGVPYQIVGSAFGDDLECLIADAGGEIGRTAVRASATLTGGIGLRTYGTAATFSSVTAYR